MDRNRVIDELRIICKAYSDIIGLVILFGSYARGDNNADSDIDLYIEPKNRQMTTAKLGENDRYKAFKIALYNNFNTDFDLLSYGGKRDINNMRKSPLWKQIETDGVLIYDQRAEVGHNTK